MLSPPPNDDSEFKSEIGVTGKDDVLFIRGVKIFESDQDLDIDGFSCGVVIEEEHDSGTFFSASELAGRCLKFNFGMRFLMDDDDDDDLPLVEEGPGELFTLESEQGLEINWKFTLLGVGVGVGGIFIWTNSSQDTSSSLLVGISKNRFDFLQCLPFAESSVDPEQLSA